MIRRQGITLGMIGAIHSKCAASVCMNQKIFLASIGNKADSVVVFWKMVNMNPNT